MSKPVGPVSNLAATFGGPRILVGAVFAWVTATSVNFALHPRGVGAVLYLATFAALVVAITIGPVVRRARPRRVWIPQVLAGICLLSSLLGRVVTFRVGPLTYSDIAYFTAALLFVLWLTVLSRHGRHGGGLIAFLDAAAMMAGAGLALWSTALAPLAGGSRLSAGLVWALYPALDVVLLALSIHLALRLGHRVTSALWLITALGLQFLLDTTYALTALLAPEVNPAPITAGYLFSFFGLALAATHSSVVELAGRAVDRRRRRHGGPGPAFVVLTILPATAIPVTGALDATVRTSLVALLLALLFSRLYTTTAAVARAEADSHHRAFHDDLTGLLNRAGVLETLDDLQARNSRDGRTTAVLFFDCDDFKYVNDTWGHRAGDTLLKDVADRVPGRLGSSDLLGRHGGDEFVVLTSVDDVTEAEALAERVQSFFADPLPILPGRVHAVTSSVGIALAGPGDAITAEDLLGNADVAMYEAKAGGRGRCVMFDADLARRNWARASVGDRLGDAVRHDVFCLELQPIMGGARYETLLGWEALARWHDPDLGEVPPDVFVPLAEQLGLICDLGETVLRRACRELARLRRAAPHDDVAVSVNVSPAQLLQPDFAIMVGDALQSAGLPGRCLWLEITETLLVDTGPAVHDTLRALREAGVGICIDDFGTGYASLATLLQLPVDLVKLDRSLVTRLGDDLDGPRQVGAVIDLVNSLGIELVVAEGVETPQQAQALRELGCPMVQGWLYGRPSTMESLLSSYATAAR